MDLHSSSQLPCHLRLLPVAYARIKTTMHARNTSFCSWLGFCHQDQLPASMRKSIKMRVFQSSMWNGRKGLFWRLALCSSGLWHHFSRWHSIIKWQYSTSNYLPVQKPGKGAGEGASAQASATLEPSWDFKAPGFSVTNCGCVAIQELTRRWEISLTASHSITVLFYKW